MNKSLLLISFVEWSGAFQRPQQMALGLARRGWRVTYASPGYLHRRGQGGGPGFELPETLNLLHPAALPGASRSSTVAWLNRFLMLRALKRHSPPNGWDCIVFNDPRWAEIAAALPGHSRIFDCMDDLSAQAPSEALMRRMTEQALAAADRVWTGTASLAEVLEGRHKSVRFIPCGVEGERFASPGSEAIQAARREMPEGEGPLAGYFGVLNERFDMERVKALLECGPWRVVLIGPATSRAPAIPSHPRLRWLGPRPYASLPAYLALFDLALIPYDHHGPHRFLYPVKALEYLAGGRPVLTTPLPDVVRFLKNYVELADTPADWAKAGQRLLADRGTALERAREGQAFARRRTWDAMLDEMEDELRQCHAKKN